MCTMVSYSSKFGSMNVTSLLNTSGAVQAAAAARLPSDPAAGGYDDGERMVLVRTASDPRSSSRNRTPWDAGGYSLPLTLNIKSEQNSSASKYLFSSETPVESIGSASPNSPKHKFSDSRSSLSSCTTMSSNTSSHSRSHSRISSLSTVSEYQPVGSFLADATPTEMRVGDSDPTMLYPTATKMQPGSISRRGLEDLSVEASDSDSAMYSDRPRSPSDAALMRNRILAGSFSPSESKNIGSFLRPESPPSSTPASRALKRTVSVPDFPSVNTAGLRSRSFPTFGSMAEPTPPKSPQRNGRRQSVASIPVSPTTAIEGNEPHTQISSHLLAEPKCMFVDPCTTGSSLRKAISHIFGRNKLCTKAIPSNIWVHYCRKHYQRSRYRNATDYALRQVELVLIQIDKVQEWSHENIKLNRRGDGVLKHWTLQARKREAKRLQESDSRKRRFVEDDDDQDLNSGTAIPGWLKSKLNKDYGTEDMLAIIKDLKDRMDTGEIQQIPDIEILPEIMTDGNESRPKTTVRRTGTTNGGHRHTKSEIYRTPTSMSSYNGRAGMATFQDHKRFRTSASPYNMPIQNLPHRPMMGMNSTYPYQMNSSFAVIAENQPDTTNFWNPQSYSNNNTVLPAPVPQRHLSVPMIPETSNVQSYAPQGRSLHGRSVSENPVLHNSGHGHPAFRPYPSQPSQGYPQQQDMFSNYQSQGYGGPTTYQGQGFDSTTMDSRDAHAHFFGAEAPSQISGSFDGGGDWYSPRNGHNRVPSNSSMHHAAMQRSVPMSGGLSSLNSLPSMANMGHHAVNNYGYGIASMPKEVGYGEYQQQNAQRY